MLRRFSNVLMLLLVLALVVIAAVGAFFYGYHYVVGENNSFSRMDSLTEQSGGNLADEATPGAIAVYIPRSADMDDITGILKNQGLISNRFLFKLVSKFNGFDGNYQAGTHYLLPGMSYDEIMYILTRQPKALKITFVEGETYLEMRQKMVAAGLNIDTNVMDDLVRHPNAFLDYDFVRQLSADPNREWLLQGYLWPDTYWFDPNMDEESILRMFLDNTENKLKEGGYAAKAAQMDLNLDQVMTIASILQKEGNISEMSKIGKVFLNRFALEMPMESCATINYLRGELGEEPIPWATDADLRRFATNPYNTYAFSGLPPGPINDPGTLAIEGILWPANEDSWPGANSYLYFCATGKGDNVFATTLEQHEANVAFYSNAWYNGEDVGDATTPPASR